MYYSVFEFLGGQGESVCPRGYAGLSQVWLWEYPMPLIFSPVDLLDVFQEGLEPTSGSMGALLFSQCNMAWRSFVWAEGSRCWGFDSSWCLFSAKCGSSISAKFLTYGAHAVCFCTLVTILDPLTHIYSFNPLSTCPQLLGAPLCALEFMVHCQQNLLFPESILQTLSW
jgi:hypothetical protein